MTSAKTMTVRRVGVWIKGEVMSDIKNAVIESVSITNDDHGCLSSWLHLDYGGCGQGFGGYALYLPKTFKHHEIKSHAGHWMWRVMEIAGVSRWSDLGGKTVRVEIRDGIVYGIGHIVKEDWFYPSVDFDMADNDNDS